MGLGAFWVGGGFGVSFWGLSYGFLRMDLGGRGWVVRWVALGFGWLGGFPFPCVSCARSG